jgi:hypothetical protein
MPDDSAAINFWFRNLFPEITEAWLLTAPDDESYVVIPIPESIYYDEIPTEGVRKALEGQFFIKSARFVEDIAAGRDTGYYGPGIEVLCISWARVRRRLGALAE